MQADRAIVSGVGTRLKPGVHIDKTHIRKGEKVLWRFVSIAERN